MHRLRLLLLILLLLVSSLNQTDAAVVAAAAPPPAAGTTAAAAPRPVILRTPRALNVSYDGRSLILNGERKLWVSGGMHYSRHQPALWAPVLQQAKDAGLVGVTSYVMWNQHENVRGAYDWGQVQPRSNITQFLQVAHDLGMLIHLRLGPVRQQQSAGVSHPRVLSMRHYCVTVKLTACPRLTGCRA